MNKSEHGARMHQGSQRSRCGSCNDLTKQERPRVLPRSVATRRPAGGRRLTRGCRGRALPSGVFYLTYLLTYTLLCRPDVLRLTSHRTPRGPDAARRAVRRNVRHPRPSTPAASGPSLAGRTLQVTVLQSHTPPRHTLPTAHNTKIPPAPVAARPSSERAGRSA
jgi:hypothetical protein